MSHILLLIIGIKDEDQFEARKHGIEITSMQLVTWLHASCENYLLQQRWRSRAKNIFKWHYHEAVIAKQLKMKIQDSKIIFDKIFLPKLKSKDTEIKQLLFQLSEERKNHEETRRRLKNFEDKDSNSEFQEKTSSKNSALEARVKELKTLLESSLKNAAGHRDLVADLNCMIIKQTVEINNLKKKCKKQDVEIGRLQASIKKFSDFFLYKLKK